MGIDEKRFYIAKISKKICSSYSSHISRNKNFSSNLFIFINQSLSVWNVENPPKYESAYFGILREVWIFGEFRNLC